MNAYVFDASNLAESSFYDSDTIGVFLAAYAAGNMEFTSANSIPIPIIKTPFLLGNAASAVSGYNEVMRDTSTSYSPMRLDKPYPVKNRVVCIQQIGGELGNVTSDMGDYIRINLGKGTNQSLYIGVCKSSLTDAYTPFGTYFSGGSYNSQIAFFDFGEILAAAMAHIGEDAVTNNLSQQDISLPSWFKNNASVRPRTLAGSVGFDRKVQTDSIYNGLDTPISNFL